MAQSGVVKTLGISGSLRKGSYNTAALRAALELLPDGMTLDIADISELPLYNDDVRQAGFPPAVKRLREQIAAADALLFATPEYNYSISGVLKNAIDWASRPPDAPVLGKPCGIMGASGGLWGTARAISPAPVLRLPQHVPHQQAGSADRPGAEQVRSPRQACRSDDARRDRAASGGAARLDLEASRLGADHEDLRSLPRAARPSGPCVDARVSAFGRPGRDAKRKHASELVR